MLDLDTTINIVHCILIGALQVASAFLYFGSQRYARRKYHKLGPEALMDDLPKHYSGSMADMNDITSSEASEPETDPEDAEALTCNVCDRAFLSLQHLVTHQEKRRHYGCSACEDVFQTLMALEHHKEALEHWTDDGGDTQDDSEDSEEDSDDSQETGLGMEVLRNADDEPSAIICNLAAERERLL